MSGIARKIKKRSSQKILACDVVGFSIFGDAFKPYLLNGVGLAWRSPNTDIDTFDGLLSIDDSDAISTCRIIAQDQGLLLGGSGGLCVFGALSVLHNTRCTNALALVPDTGVNYLDQFYDDSWIDKNGVKLKNRIDLLHAIKNLNSRNRYFDFSDGC